MIRNALAYHLPEGWPWDADAMSEYLSRRTFQPCGKLDHESSGFVPPRDEANLCHAVGEFLLVCLQTEERILPAYVVTEHADLKAMAQRGQIECIPGHGKHDGRYGLLRPIAKAAAGEKIDYQDNADDALPPSIEDQHESLKLRHAAYDNAVGEIHRICHDAGIPAGLVHERVEQLAQSVAQQADTIAAKVKVIDDLRAELSNAKALADKLEHLLGVERQANAALREQLDGMVIQTIEGAVPAGYLVRAPKRAHRIVTKPEKAQAHALAAARNGSGRGEVFALVHLGTAKRGAVWSPAK